MSTDPEPPAARKPPVMLSGMLPVFGRLLPDPAQSPSSQKRALQLWLEALLFSAIALLIARGLRVPQSGFFAVFLAAAALSSRLNAILDENRAAILERRTGPWRANLATAGSVLALFLGMLTAFGAAAVLFGEEEAKQNFGFILQAAQLERESILTRSFASTLPVFLHNALVLSVFVVLGFVYRVYGALLVLAWNACTWGLVLCFLIARGVAASSIPAPLFVAVSGAAVLPHLILEAAAYVLAALAAIFISKGVTKYAIDDPILKRVLGAAATMIAIALACLLIAAFLEATIPALVLSLLSPQSRG